MISRIALSFALVLSGPVGAVAAEGDKWSSYVDVEGKLGTDRNLGEVSLFVPLGQSHESLFFGNLISRIDDQDSFEGNVGLGYREIVDGSYIVGGYAYFDRRKSASDNYFNQITAGAELMTDVWTARTNVYFADNDLKPTSGGVVTQTGTQIFVQSNLEGALSGFDAEVGRVIPLGLDDVTLTGFAGGFHFDRSSFDNVSGPRARAELAFDNLWDGMLPSGTQLRFGAEVQHDDVRDTQGFLSARLRVPLFGSASSSNLSGLDRRMVDPVVRDIDVVAGAGLSAPVAPVLQSNGATIRSANIIDADDDLGVALAAAGQSSLVVVDGSKGVITSAMTARALPGQAIVGGANAGIVLRDETTGVMIAWNPLPGGTRPTLDSVQLAATADNHISGLTMKSSFLTAGNPSFVPLALGGLILLTPGGLIPLAPGINTGSLTVDDIDFTGNYAFSSTLPSALIGLDGVSNAAFSNIAFSGVSYTAGKLSLGIIDGIRIANSQDVSFSGISVRNAAINGGTITRFTGVDIDSSKRVFLSDISLENVILTAQDPAPILAGAAFRNAQLEGLSIVDSQDVVINGLTLSNLSATHGDGTANVVGVQFVSGMTSASMSNVVIDGLSESGTNADNPLAFDLVTTGAGDSLSVSVTNSSISGVGRAAEFRDVGGSATIALSGSGNTLGAGVGGCVNNTPATLTVTGSISFTNGSTCP